MREPTQVPRNRGQIRRVAKITAVGRIERTSVTQLMISFEPQHDTPGRLNSYAKSHGMKCDDHCRMLQIDDKSMPQVVKNLDVPVNYNSGWVNIHGVALYLVDHNGRLARKYHTVLWDNQAVVEDLTKLLKEEK